MASDSYLPARMLDAIVPPAGPQKLHLDTGCVRSVSDRFREEQLVRTDGTVIVSWLVAPGMICWWEPPLGFDITGPCFGRVRFCDPVTDWYVIASFPRGYPGPMEWSAKMPPGMEFRAELEWLE